MAIKPSVERDEAAVPTYTGTGQPTALHSGARFLGREGRPVRQAVSNLSQLVPNFRPGSVRRRK